MAGNLFYKIGVHLLVLLFVYTGLTKLMDYTAFRAALIKSPPLRSWAGTIAWALPVAELLVAILLLLPRWRGYGIGASLLLLVLLTGYLGWMILYAPHLPCNCGGVVSGMSWRQHVWFNGGFIVLNGMVAYLHKRRGQ